MPHITIEYSSNAADSFDFRSFGQILHERMAPLIDTDLESCKTRFVELKDTLIGDGSAGKAMIHVDVRILSGRTQDQKTTLGRAALAAAQSFLDRRPSNLQLTVEISDIDVDNYHKLVLTS